MPKFLKPADILVLLQSEQDFIYVAFKGFISGVFFDVLTYDIG